MSIDPDERNKPGTVVKLLQKDRLGGWRARSATTEAIKAEPEAGNSRVDDCEPEGKSIRTEAWKQW